MLAYYFHIGCPQKNAWRSVDFGEGRSISFGFDNNDNHNLHMMRVQGKEHFAVRLYPMLEADDSPSVVFHGYAPTSFRDEACWWNQLFDQARGVAFDSLDEVFLAVREGWKLTSVRRKPVHENWEMMPMHIECNDLPFCIQRFEESLANDYTMMKKKSYFHMLVLEELRQRKDFPDKKFLESCVALFESVPIDIFARYVPKKVCRDGEASQMLSEAGASFSSDEFQNFVTKFFKLVDIASAIKVHTVETSKAEVASVKAMLAHHLDEVAAWYVYARALQRAKAPQADIAKACAQGLRRCGDDERSHMYRDLFETFEKKYHMLKLCDQCVKPSLACRICERCKGATYCSVTCQKKHWKIHKPACQSK